MFIFHIACLLALIALASAGSSDQHNILHSLGRRRVVQDRAEMRTHMADVMSDYHERAVTELAAGRSFFSIKSKKDSFSDDLKMDSYESIVKEAFHDTDVQFTAHDVDKVHYHHLDVESTSLLRSKQLDHCNGRNRAKLDLRFFQKSIGDTLLIGKSIGPDGKEVKYSFHRVVNLKQSTSNGNCATVETEQIHFMELFNKVRVESTVVRPSQIVYSQVNKTSLKTTAGAVEKTDVPFEDATFKGKRNPRSLAMSPDYPLKTCTDAYWDSPSSYSYYSSNSPITSNGIEYLYFFGTLGCAYMNMMLPGTMSMNYNFGTQKAVTDPITIPKVNGISCKNCYAFFGAEILMIMEYNSGVAWGYGDSFYMFEASISGGAGFNVDIEIVDPSVSGSVSATLLPAASNYGSIAIPGTGLTLMLKFGGLSAVVTGSGSAKGRLSTGAGAGYTLKASLLYDGSSLSLPYSSKATLTPPFFSSTGFTSVNANVAVTLFGVINLQLMFGSGSTFVSAKFNADMKGTTELSYSSSRRRRLEAAAKDSFSSSIGENSMDGEDIIQISPQKASYKLGEKITLVYKYYDIPIGENTEVYFAIETDGKTFSYVTQSSFVASPEGIVSVDWTIPWDAKFGNNTDSFAIVAHSTDSIMSTFKSKPFHVVGYTETDSIFDVAPADGSEVATKSDVKLTWAPDRLSYLISKTFGGLFVVEDEVSIQLVSEITTADGSIRTQVLAAKNVSNTGSATFFIEESYVDTSNSDANGARYYMVLSSNKYSDIWGWSSGYFTIKCDNCGASPRKLSVSDRSYSTLKAKLLSSANSLPAVTARGHHADDRRHLQSCGSSGVTVSSGAAYGGDYGGFTASLLGYTYNNNANPNTQWMTLYSPVSKCLAIPQPTPTAMPTLLPTRKPSAVPTTAMPTMKPSAVPTTAFPTMKPSAVPTTAMPTMKPSAVPTTAMPTMKPSAAPTTAMPTMEPSAVPTTAMPTMEPSAIPTKVSTSAKPTLSPTKAAKPTLFPTLKPSFKPTSRATERPTTAPTAQPTTKVPKTNKPTKVSKV